MKRIFMLSLAICFISVAVTGQGMAFFNGSLDSAKSIAMKNNRMIFIDCFTTWCVPCKKMADNTFPDPEVGSYFNANFISMQIDMEKEGEGKEFGKAYNITGYPSLIVIDGRGNVIHRATGMLDSKTFLEFGKAASDPEKRLSTLVNMYKNGRRDSAFVKKYIDVAGRNGTDVKEAADWYLSTLKEEDLFTPENFSIVTGYAKGFSSPVFMKVLSNYSDIKDTDVKAATEDYINGNFMSEMVNAARVSKDSFMVVAGKVKKTGYKNADRVVEENMIGFSRFEGDMNQFAKLSVDFVEKYNSGSLSKKVFVAKDLSVYDKKDQVTDKSSLERALSWLKEAEVKNMSGDNAIDRIEDNTAIALIYHKLGNKKDALKAAKNAQIWTDKYNAANNDEKNIGRASYAMASLFNKLGDKKTALKQANMAMDYVVKAKKDPKPINALIDQINGVSKPKS